jgi:hypothetical protein
VDTVLDREIVSGVLPSDMTARQVEHEFRKLIGQGVRIRPAGRAKDDPLSLLSRGYTPKHKLRLFDATYYLTNSRYDINFAFFVAYVLLEANPTPHAAPREREIHPRLFYKDLSLVWRVATHYIRSEEDNWIGKGDLKRGFENGIEMEYSAEETTNLPLEIQSALDVISRRARARRDDRAVELVLRNAPDGRFEPYHDFIAPRRKAASYENNLINQGEYVAFFERENDPTSLRFVSGFEPDFKNGVIEVSWLRSRMYGGDVGKFRILSKNGEIQYQFVAAPKHVWIIPPQALTTEITTYGVRTIDVTADEDLFVPGYEYHFIDETEEPPRLLSQIPEGFAGEASEVDPSRGDASPWLDMLPVIERFRKTVLGRARRERSCTPPRESRSR